MRNTFVPGVGGVLSADIAVPDHANQVSFYAKVLTTGDAPLWRDDLMNNEGTPVIGLGERTPEYENLPLQWMPHFQVADVAASYAAAIELGGKEILRDEGFAWAGLEDPCGAAFGIIPAVDPDSLGAQANENVGCIAWLSLRVPDPKGCREFYEKVIGWKSKASSEAEGDASHFEMQIGDNHSVAEIGDVSAEIQNMGALWLMHLPVGDLETSLSNVTEQGGEVVAKVTDPDCVVLRDPVGVCFALVEVKRR